MQRSPLRAVWVAALVLSIGVVFWIQRTPPTAAADAEQSLELVLAVYDILDERFIRPVSSRELLGAAWRGASRSAGATAALVARGPSLSDDAAADRAEFARAYRELLGAALGANPERIAFDSADAMVESLREQHTALLRPEEFARFRESLVSDRSVVGIGVQLSGERGPFRVQHVFPNTPAHRSGLAVDDLIERVDDRDVRNRDLSGLAQLLRGEAGTTVQLQVRRSGASMYLALQRERYIVPPLLMTVLPEGVCHLALSSFPFAFSPGPSGKTIGEDLDDALESCESAGVVGWIIDLRGNGGGSSLSQVAGRFIDGVPLLVERDRDGGRYEQAPDGHLFRVQRPLVVLIDRESASASEGLAIAVQETRRGLVVGQRSAGVLNTAGIVSLPLGAGLEVAIREVFAPRSERTIDGVGVMPDIVVSDPTPRVALDEAVAAVTRPPSSVGPLSALPLDVGSSMLPSMTLRQRIEPVQLRDSDSPVGGGIAGDLLVDRLTYYSGDTPDMDAARERGVRLGWRGGMVRWIGGGFPPPYALDVELYATPEGATQDLNEIYQPGEPHNRPQSYDVTPIVRFGDEVRYQVGTKQNDGRIWIAWRRGAAIFVASRTVTPGQPKNFDSLVQLAGVIDARAAALGY
jgi:carboxyl-terminal processing protease